MSTNTTSNSRENQFLESIEDLFLTRHVRQPTRYREGKNPSLLDLILTNEEDMIESLTYNQGLGKSDLIMTLSTVCVEHVNMNNTTRPKHYKANYGKINNLFQKEALSYENASAQMSWNVFEKNYIKDNRTKHTKV